MGNACCAKPIVKIIKVADVEAGLNGLDLALQNVYLLGLDDDEKLKNELLRWIRDFGNYVAPGREGVYKDALLREYKLFVAEMEQQRLRRLAEQQAQTEGKGVVSKWRRWFGNRKTGSS